MHGQQQKDSNGWHIFCCKKKSRYGLYRELFFLKDFLLGGNCLSTSCAHLHMRKHGVDTPLSAIKRGFAAFEHAFQQERANQPIRPEESELDVAPGIGF